MKGVWSVANNIAVFFGALSLVLLFQHAVSVGWVAPLELLLSLYVGLKSALFGLLDPVTHSLLEFLAARFNLTLKLGEHWTDVVVLLALYLGARARSYLTVGKTMRAILRAALGSIVALISGLGAGLVDPVDGWSSLLMACIPLGGLLVFEVVDGAYSATFFRKQGLSWGADFIRYGLFSFPPIFLGSALALVAAFGLWLGVLENVPAVGWVAQFIFIIVLIVYWMGRGWFHAKDVAYRTANESHWSRFVRSSNTRIGILMLKVTMGAVLFLALNAGLVLLGVEVSY